MPDVPFEEACPDELADGPALVVPAGAALAAETLCPVVCGAGPCGLDEVAAAATCDCLPSLAAA